MAFSINNAWQVTAGYLKHPLTLTEKQIQEVTCISGGDGKPVKFVRLAKTDGVIYRLLTGKSKTKSEPNLLTRTSLIEQVITLRNKKRAAEIDQMILEEHDRSMAGKIDVSIHADGEDSTPKKAKKKSATIVELPDKYITIAAPSIGPVGSINLKVLVEQNSSKPNPRTVWVEMNTTSLAYMRAAIQHQLDSGEDHDTASSRDRKPVGVPGISRVYSGKRQGQYRLKVVGRNKKPRTKFIKALDDEAAKQTYTSMLREHGADDADDDEGCDEDVQDDVDEECITDVEE